MGPRQHDGFIVLRLAATESAAAMPPQARSRRSRRPGRLSRSRLRPTSTSGARRAVSVWRAEAASLTFATRLPGT